MARPLRLEFAGAMYHLTARGDRREDIYETDDDRRSFLSLLGEVCDRFNWICHAYCLMSNHYQYAAGLGAVMEPQLVKCLPPIAYRSTGCYPVLLNKRSVLLKNIRHLSPKVRACPCGTRYKIRFFWGMKNSWKRRGD